ncbi:MAG: alpha/beta hydrolase, partial [Variovorax sp.]
RAGACANRGAPRATGRVTRWLIWVATPLLALAALAALALWAPLPTLNLIARVAGGFDVRADVPYGPLPRQRLDVYTPRGTAPAGGWPMVVFFYGGSWNNGARADYAFVGAALASHGALVLVADYRLYPEVRYPDFLADSAQALAYGLKEASRLGADPKRVYVMGHSAGAYNAAMLALDPRWLTATGHAPTELAGLIGLAGPYDFFPTDDRDAQPVFFHPNYPVGAQPIEHASAGVLAFIGAGTPR